MIPEWVVIAVLALSGPPIPRLAELPGQPTPAPVAAMLSADYSTRNIPKAVKIPDVLRPPPVVAFRGQSGDVEIHGIVRIAWETATTKATAVYSDAQGNTYTTESPEAVLLIPRARVTLYWTADGHTCRVVCLEDGYPAN